MNGAALQETLERLKTFGRRAMTALTARLASVRRAPKPHAPPPPAFDGAVKLSPTGSFRPPADDGTPLAPVFESPEEDDDDYEPTRIFEPSESATSAPAAEPLAVRGKVVLARLHDLMLAGALAALVGGVVEAIQLQSAGLGPPARVGAVRFIAISGLAAVPVGAVVGAFLFAVLAVIPRERLAGLRGRMGAPFVYAVGIVLPLMMAGTFRLFIFLRTSFQNESLAALASAFLSALVFGGAYGVGLLVAAGARAVGARYPEILRRRVAVGSVLALWTLIALPSFLAGPDDALRGPFGFIGLLRKDTLDYKPVVTLGFFAAGFSSWLLLVRMTRPIKAVLSFGLAVWAAIAAVRASDDLVRPVVLERGLLTRASLRGLQTLGDWDRDGFSRWLGGGDCNDSDPRIHPGARDIPGNGIDEDCDGEDLQLPKAPTRPVVGTARAARPPLPSDLSFLFITIDTLRPDLGYLGYPRDVSPHIDHLASQSTIYERAYSISTYTGYCLPPLMASRYPSEMPRTNRHEVRYLPQNVLLAERLRQAGFKTSGAASHFLFSPQLGWTDGFDHFVLTAGEGNAPPGSHIDRFYTSRTLADAAIGILKDPEVTQGRFFVWIHFLDPHHQYLKHPGFSKWGNSPRDLYDGEVAFTDYHVGRVLEALDASPLADRTVVVLTGDHGEAFGEHGEYFHGREIWDEIVRVPLIIRTPRGVPRRIARRVSHTDLAPTVLDLAGLPPDPGARGQSLAAELFGGDLPEHPILIDQPRNPYYDAKRAFIEGGLKLHLLLDTNTYRLFDLDHDPGETRDLVPEDPAALTRIRRDYAQYASQIVPVEPISPAEAERIR